MIDTRVLTGPRWSSAVVCPRRSVYEGLDYPREPYTPETLALFRRGRYIGAAMAHDLEDLLNEAGLPLGEAEVEIPWPAFGPIGTGHADYYRPDEQRIIEWLSSVDPSLPHHKALQAGGYAIYHPEATCATVLVVDPITYSETRYDLDLDGLREEVERVAEKVRSGLVDGVLPERPEAFESPNDWNCQGCPFIGPCWKGWEPWPVGELPASVHEDLTELAALRDRISRAKKVDSLEVRAKEIQERLKGSMVPGAKYHGPGIKSIHYTPVAGRRNFSLKNFEAAGHTLPPPAAEFVTETKGYDLFKITRAEGDE